MEILQRDGRQLIIHSRIHAFYMLNQPYLMEKAILVFEN